MSYNNIAHPVLITAALNQLENLNADEYIIVTGPQVHYFHGTPNGYSATFLPAPLYAEVFAGQVKRITWVSFGSQPKSWFFAYEKADGSTAIQIGPDVPAALTRFIAQLNGPDHLLANLRIQLGNDESFVAWTGTVWASSNIPHTLHTKLRQLSSACRDSQGITHGSLRDGTLDNVQWHQNGSFYIKSGDHHEGHYPEETMRTAWDGLWKGDADFKELAHVTIDPYGPNGDCFVFLKKQQQAEEVPFTFHLRIGCTISNISHSAQASHASTSLQHAQKPNEPIHYQWATSKKSGRPHTNEAWELVLTKSERVKVLRDLGRDWFSVLGSKGKKGCVHRSWLDFGDYKLHEDPKTAYQKFHDDLQELLIPGQMCDFPVMSDYMDTCTKNDCKVVKEGVGSLGICVHDLAVLLEGSGCYNKEWLKEGRNMWHPDRFARFCHPAHAERLKPMAEKMFVLYGVLMEMV